jgi:hypothetical protein
MTSPWKWLRASDLAVNDEEGQPLWNANAFQIRGQLKSMFLEEVRRRDDS